MTQILYGVGKSILRDFKDETKVIALSKLKNVSIEATASDEKIYGGDSPYPIASFPKEKSITVSAENAVFDMKLLNATQGANMVAGAVKFDEVIEIIIPADGQVNLDFEPIDGSLIVDGFTAGVTTPTAGQFVIDGTDASLVKFAVDDAGKEVTIIYQRNSGATTNTMSIYKETLAKPFKFIHRIPVYDEDNAVVGHAQLIVYKAKSNNQFSFGLQPQTAFAPKVDFEALDPKRPDGKLWDFSIETL